MPTKLLIALAVLGLTSTACELFDTDFEGSVALRFAIESGASPDDQCPDLGGAVRYCGINEFNPETNEDFADNKDRLKTGTIEWLELTVISVGPDNGATRIRGRADLLTQEGVAIPGVATWGSMRLVQGNSISVEIPDDRARVFTDLVFESDEVQPLQILVGGSADQAPARFDLEAVLHMRFTAGI